MPPRPIGRDMAWNPELLSTVATIAEHEKEVNDLAGKTSTWALIGGEIDESNDYEVTCPDGTDYVVYTDADGNSITDDTVTTNVWTLPSDAVLGFSCYDSSDAVLAVFSAMPGLS